MLVETERFEPMPLDTDREVWERQSTERLIYYRWFQRYLDTGSDSEERSLRKLYSAVNPPVKPQAWAQIARIWRWRERAELYDEYVIRASRESFIRQMELVAARHARQATVISGVGMAVIRKFMERFREIGNQLTFGELQKLWKTANEAVELGHREERAARGYNRALIIPQVAQDDLTRLVDNMEMMADPEIDAAYREIEEVLIRRTRVRISEPSPRAITAPYVVQQSEELQPQIIPTAGWRWPTLEELGIEAEYLDPNRPGSVVKPYPAGVFYFLIGKDTFAVEMWSATPPVSTPDEHPYLELLELPDEIEKPLEKSVWEEIDDPH